MKNGSSKLHIRELWSPRDALTLDRFERAIRDGDMARALFALEGADDARVARGLTTLNALAARVLDRLPPHPDLDDKVDALRLTLADESSFQGDSQDYYNPRNSQLSVVLERQRGIPILLGAIWCLVGQRAGIQVEGVGMPGHFLVRVGGDDGELVDPFNAGRPISVEECSHIIYQLSGGQLRWSDRFLESVDACAFYERVLRNLISSYEQREEAVPLYRCVRFLATLRRDEPDPQILHAHLAEALGAFSLAIECYEDICARFPSTEQAQVSASRLSVLDHSEQMLN